MYKVKVVTKGNELEVWANGFHGESGRIKAQSKIDEGYWHRYMYEADKSKTLITVKYD